MSELPKKFVILSEAKDLLFPAHRNHF